MRQSRLGLPVEASFFPLGIARRVFRGREREAPAWKATSGQHEIPSLWTSYRVLPMLADARGTLKGRLSLPGRGSLQRGRSVC